jgi:hypothetical protein
MQQRQLRLGDILDDYCPRERRLTNHAVVAMIGDEVKQTRCTTCDAEHVYKHAKVPRQRRRDTPAALYANVAASGPKRVPHEHENGVADVLDEGEETQPQTTHHPDPTDDGPAETLESPVAASGPEPPPLTNDDALNESEESDEPRLDEDADVEEGPVHRPLIRATLPRPEGQPPPARPGPDFTIRQPGGRQNRFRNRHQRGGQQFFGNRSNGNMGGAGSTRGGMPRQGGGRPPHGSMSSRSTRRQGGGPGRKRSK